MLRSIGAVIVGYALFAASGFALFHFTGQPPHGRMSATFILGFVVYGIVFALLGGYVAAWLAGRRPLRHGAAVAILLAVLAAISLLATMGKGVVYTQVLAMVFMAPAALAGGWLRRRVANAAHPPVGA